MNARNSLDQFLADCQHVIQLPVLWGDMDAFKHVNNTAHIRWFESSRVSFLEDSKLVELMKAEKFGPILVSISCNYKKQLKYPDTVHIGSNVSKIGRTSMVIDHRIVSEQNEYIAAEGQSVIVIFDYQAQRPVRIPEEVKQAVSEFEKR